MLKIVHFGDVHLDCPFSLLDIKKSARMRRLLRDTFSAAVALAAAERAAVVLIPGDLFESGSATADTVSFLSGLFESAPGCRFVISPGNHDPFSPGSVYDWAKFPENVCVFNSETPSRFVFGDVGAEVWGWAFTSPRLETNPLAAADEYPPPEGIRLLCAHADLGAAVSRYAPITAADLRRGGFAYAALGHIHNPPPHPMSDGAYAYGGFMMGRGFDECGWGGIYIVEFGGDGAAGSDRSGTPPVVFLAPRDTGVRITELEPGGAVSRFRRVDFTAHRYEDLSLDIDGAVSDAETGDAIAALISKRGFGGETALRVTLTGSVPAEYTPNLPRLQSEITNLDFIKIRDATLPRLNTEYFARDISVRGQFYRLLSAKLESDNPRERSTAALALKYGLAALEGRPPSVEWL